MSHLIVLMIPRNCITVFSMRTFAYLSPFTATSGFAFFNNSFFSEGNDGWLCVALQRHLTIFVLFLFLMYRGVTHC